ncbi:MAG: diguanylate cyclase [Magnetovibrio sp.]|nr:diguanylate cyclase [Magnetovibrio sp.]
MPTIRTLLVEDSSINRKIIRRYMGEGRSDSYDVVEATTLSEALIALQVAQFDIVLLDLMLPDSVDMATLDAIREQSPDVAIIVLTASGDTTTAKQALKRGCQDFLIKGAFDGNLLRHAIRYSVERAHMAAELRLNEQRFQDFAAAGADWFWEMGPELTFTYLSDEFTAITGLNAEDSIGKDIAINTSQQHSDAKLGTYRKKLQDHKPINNFEYIAAMEAGGGEQWFRISGLPVFDKDNVFQGYRGTGVDISIEKYDEMQTQRGKDLVDGILATSLDGFLVLQGVRDTNNHIADLSFSHVNRRAEEILGRNRSELMGRLFRLEMPHMISQGVMKHCIQTLDTGTPFDLEQLYHEKTMQGWVRIIGVKLGESVVITLSDINARKEAEREQRLATALFQTSAQGMLISDAGNRIISANPAFSKITGYDLNDAIGHDPKFLSSGRHDEDFYHNLWKDLKHEGHWVGEIWNRRKNGELFVQHQNISVIRNEQGEIENFVAVFKDATEQKEREEQLYQRANYDALTGLPNRALLEDRIATAIPKAERDQVELGIMFIDLDGFKPVNDTYGHLAGDFVLQEIAKRLTDCVRESDTVARLGGDEFLIMALGVEGRKSVEVVAKGIFEALEAPFVYEGVNLNLGASVGIAMYPEHGSHPVELIERSDKAMYKVKGMGKGAFSFYDPDFNYDEVVVPGRDGDEPSD